MKFLESCCLFAASILFLQACTASREPQASGPAITAEVVSIPEGLEMTFRGKAIGQAPLEVPLASFDDAVQLSTAQEAPPVIERRVTIVGPDRLRVSVRLGDEPSPLARKLGLSRVMVFDYGDNMTFRVDESEVREEFLPMLQRQAVTLEKYFGSVDVYVCGHTDSLGEEDYNRLLSVRRAQAVADVLVSNGLDKGRIKVQGFGPDFPISSNETREGRGLNRRTEIVLPD